MGRSLYSSCLIFMRCDMDIRKVFIENRMLDVVSPEEYARRESLNDKDLLQDTCIEKDNVIYPVFQNPIYGRALPYFVSTEWANLYFNRENTEGYEADKIVDLTNVKNTEELITKQEELRNSEIATLVANSGEVFSPVIREEDSTALKLVKECLTAKRINVNNYKTRFDSSCDFSNTIRLLTNEDNHTISIQKMQLIGDKFDINFKITASDKKQAPNPMREKITKEL